MTKYVVLTRYSTPPRSFRSEDVFLALYREYLQYKPRAPYDERGRAELEAQLRTVDESLVDRSCTELARLLNYSLYTFSDFEPTQPETPVLPRQLAAPAPTGDRRANPRYAVKGATVFECRLCATFEAQRNGRSLVEASVNFSFASPAILKSHERTNKHKFVVWLYGPGRELVEISPAARDWLLKNGINLELQRAPLWYGEKLHINAKDVSEALRDYLQEYSPTQLPKDERQWVFPKRHVTWLWIEALDLLANPR